MLFENLDIAYINKNNDGLDESSKINEMHAYLRIFELEFSHNRGLAEKNFVLKFPIFFYDEILSPFRYRDFQIQPAYVHSQILNTILPFLID